STRGQDVMHRNLCDAGSRNLGRGGWGLDVLAAVLLSFGVGAATAAFTAMNGFTSHGGPNIACETMLAMSSGPPAYMDHAGATLPSAAEVHERIADAYQASYAVGGVAPGTWSDLGDELDLRPLVRLFAATALAMLLACTRGAARLGAATRAPAIAAGSAFGALVIATMLIGVFGLPALGLRAIAFAVSVSLLAARFPRGAWQELVSATG
ncbi:MAG TPA: hypothetical protein VKP02_15185, partial [Gemmatimonadaceae bacterium]|nr:hypothetical protein [Gemmatimonadaceae bacterium]